MRFFKAGDEGVRMTPEELSNWLWNSPQKTHSQIYEAIMTFVDEAVSDALKDREVSYEKDLKMQIDRAVREAREDLLVERISRMPDGRQQAYEQGKDEGFASAIEAAAKVVDEASPNHTHAPCLQCDYFGPLIGRIKSLRPTSEEGK